MDGQARGAGESLLNTPNLCIKLAVSRIFYITSNFSHDYASIGLTKGERSKLIKLYILL
jgi:hypothetical protein